MNNTNKVTQVDKKNSTSLVDLSRIKVAADSHEEEEELLKLFFDGAVAKITAMKKAVKENNLKSWKEAAHYLKGSAANLGMKAVSDACRTAELAEPETKLINKINTYLKSARSFLMSEGYKFS